MHSEDNMILGECWTGDHMDRLKGASTGFRNHAITSFAITGKQPARCKLYADTGCHVPVVEESSANGPVFVPSRGEIYGDGTNDEISSVQCWPI